MRAVAGVSRRSGAAPAGGMDRRNRELPQDAPQPRPRADPCRRSLRHAACAISSAPTPAAFCRCSNQHDFTFLIEDPATVWNLGPQRYPQIADALPAAHAAAGQARHRHQHRRALSGRLSHQSNRPARNCFNWCTCLGLVPACRPVLREFSILARICRSCPRRRPGHPLGTNQAIELKIVFEARSRRAVDRSCHGGWARPGRWATPNTVWLPPGPHTVEPGMQPAPAHLVDLNATLKAASAIAEGFEFAYDSNSRALAKLDRLRNDADRRRTIHPRLRGLDTRTCPAANTS